MLNVKIKRGLFMKIFRLKNMPLQDTESGNCRGRRCNLITFFCPRCGTVHSIERNQVVCIEFEHDQYMCCYESVRDIVENCE